MKQAGIEDQVAEVVRAADAIADCEVHSFYPNVVRAMRGVEPRMAAALLTDGRRVVDWQEFFGFALSLNAQGVSVYYAFATPEIVRQGQKRSLTFMTWTVDGEEDMAKMRDAGVDSICSNFPDLVRRVVAGRASARLTPPSATGRNAGVGESLVARFGFVYCGLRTGVAQLEEQRSPKPPVGGSSPSTRATIWLFVRSRAIGCRRCCCVRSARRPRSTPCWFN